MTMFNITPVITPVFQAQAPCCVVGCAGVVVQAVYSDGGRETWTNLSVREARRNMVAMVRRWRGDFQA